MERSVVSEFRVAAPLERVWRVLADTAAYPQWNPLVLRLRHRGGFVAGRRALVSVELLPGRSPLWIPVTLRCVDHLHELSWEGGVGGLIHGVHFHRLHDIDGSSTRVVHGETFTGLLTPLLWRRLEPVLLAGYERFKEALTARSESLDRPPS